MSITARAPRPPAAGGGRALLLLGVLLALAAGAIAIFVVSQYSGGGGQQETVVVATTDVQAGTRLSVSGGNGFDAISADFTEQRVNYAPSNVYVFSSTAALDSYLNNQIVTQTIYKGDFLFTGDPRINAGGGAPGSLTNINPTQFPTNDVLFVLNLQGPSGGASGANSKPVAVAGDHVDLIETECNLPAPAHDPNQCETQTTETNLYVYAVASSQIVLVVSHQQAVELLYLSQTGNTEVVVRNPNDTTTASNTVVVDGGYIVNKFKY